MKKFFGILLFMTACLMTTSCGIFGLGTKTGSASVSGQASGAALKGLYSQYKTDGQIDVTNLNNIILLAQLSNGIQGLKGVDEKSEFYNDFAEGLILGSDRLVTKKSANPVTEALQTLASGTDLSTITAAGVFAQAESEQASQTAKQTVAETSQAAQQAVQQTTTQVSAAAQETVSEAVEVLSDAKDEVSSTLSSLSSIFGLFGN